MVKQQDYLNKHAKVIAKQLKEQINFEVFLECLFGNFGKRTEGETPAKIDKGFDSLNALRQPSSKASRSSSEIDIN